MKNANKTHPLMKERSDYVKVYVVLGFQNIYDNDSLEKDIYGVFSSEELANECVNTIIEELEYLDHCEIEVVELDEFGYR